MAYTTKVFSEGEVLTHLHMNNIIDGINESQKKLVSGVNIKTINGNSILGEGDITIIGGDSNLTVDYELVGENDYTILNSFVRPAGTKNDNATSYGRTDFIDITNINTLEIHIHAGSTSVSPVVWYDSNKEYISGETIDIATQLIVKTYTVPENASYAIFSTLLGKGSHVNANKNVTLQEYINLLIPDESKLLNICYISPNGSDDNDGKTNTSPILTFDKAKKILSPNGELIFMDGDYNNFEIDLSYFAKISTEGKNANLLYYKHKIVDATKYSQYDKIYYCDIPSSVSSVSYIWQHGIEDAATLIKNEERHPIQRERNCRLINTRIYNVSQINALGDDLDTTLSTMNNNANDGIYSYYITSNKIYFTSPADTFIVNPIIFPLNTPIKGNTKRKINISGLNIMYSYLLTTNLSGEINNVSVGYQDGAGSIRWDDTFDLTLINCEACASKNDGINGHASGDITLFNCWGHDNSDDGESDHETCHITQYGGLYEYNGNGCTPASNASGEYYNTICRNNGDYPWVTDNAGTGFSAQGDSATILCNSCLSIFNKTGFRYAGNGSNGIFINCVSSNDNLAFEAGTKYNCITIPEN